MNNMKQLEYLMRLHVMIALMYNEGDEKSLQTFLASHSFVMLIWKVYYTLYSLIQFIVKILFPESLYHHSKRKP